jgi:hypothetical protein
MHYSNPFVTGGQKHTHTCQERTSLSSCEANIWATNAMLKKVVDFCNLSRSVSESGHTIDGHSSLMVLYNNNDA